jgi:hypothetical protein
MKIKLLSLIVILSNLVLYSNSNLTIAVDDTTRCNPKPGGYLDMVYNVTDPDPEGHGGAKGNDIVDDAPAIQAWLNKIASNIKNTSCERGGTIYFPPGIYRIGSTLKIPPRCVIFGLSGGYTQSYDYNSEYYKDQSVVIKLKDDASCNMIEPYPLNAGGKHLTNYESVVIEGISLFGNKPVQGGNGTLKGIYMPSNIEAKKGIASNDAYDRSNLIIRNVLICNINGYGFYSEDNKEYYLDNVISRGNARDGFHIINGEDIYFHRVGSGDNGANGIYFYRSGSIRFTNCDTWGSRQYGLNIEECYGFYCNTVIVNNNFQSGARIMGSGLITFVNSLFSDNSETNWTTPTYPDVEILPNVTKFGVYGLKFIGCRFGSMDESRKTLYAVQENSTNSTIRSNAFIGCTFITKSIYSPTICDQQVLDNYIFEGCTAGADGQEEIYNPSAYLSVENKANIELKKQNKIVSINNSSQDCIVQLPSLASVPVGKEYILIKATDNLKITVNPVSNELINNKPQLVIPGTLPVYSQIKLINGGKSWIHILSEN